MRADAATRKTRIGHAIAHPPLARAAARARGPLQGGQARPRGALPLLTPARMRPLTARRGARAPLGARALWRPSGGAADIRLPHAGARRAPNPRRGFFDRCSRPLVSSSAACARTLQRALTALRGGARRAHCPPPHTHTPSTRVRAPARVEGRACAPPARARLHRGLARGPSMPDWPREEHYSELARCVRAARAGAPRACACCVACSGWAVVLVPSSRPCAYSAIGLI